MMDSVTLIATATFGLEAVVKWELQALGYDSLSVSGGRVSFPAALADIAKTNLWLRSADRVLLQMGTFTAVTFDDLFEQTKALPWEQIIPADGAFPVIGKSVKSQLSSVPTCQAIVKKAVAERLLQAHGVSILPETAGQYTIQVALTRDTAVLTIDSSGSGLHKRGYRTEAGDAPLKETLAAGLVQLSYWHPERLLIDPMCGAGTILIEAAMIGRNIAPGLRRTFAAEQWPVIPSEVWQRERETAVSLQQPDRPLRLFGYDIDPEAIAMSQRNAERAGVADAIQFAQKDVKALWIDQQYGIVITNPPYGRRLADYQTMNDIYISLNKTFRKKKGWSVYVLTADKKFPNYFKRARPNRVRKLYNGSIEVNYYQYYGDKPPKDED
ncbi:MAG: class I SAM-dependent RNA methyltransferase [Candidatus Thermofonsia bacterium]|nr:MAG: class I SAM-dependent RNA methyltransferase [Candidatus Thermofonsia bacterium]